MTILRPQAVVPILALVFVFLAASSATNKSLTWDEPTFITSGYTYLDRSDFRLNPEAPPLMQKLVALPIWLGEFEAPDYDHRHWKTPQQVAFARDHLLRNGDHINDLAFWSRFPVWIVGACLIISGGTFCTRLVGGWSGAVFALLVALSPNLLAHGRLATTDFGCAALMFGSVFAFWQAIEDQRPQKWLIAGTLTGLALLAKYTSLLLGPIFIILGLYEWRSGRIRLNEIARGTAILIAVGMALLFIGYGLQFGPAKYVDGLGTIYSRYTEGFRFYLLGQALNKPVWYYHLVAFVLKTPEPTLLLLLISVYSVFRSPRLQRPAVYVGIPALLVIFVSSFDQAHLGLRRILPAYPFLFALIAIAGTNKPCRFCRHVYIGLIVWASLASLMAYPHYLSYFNILSGGISNGPYLLEDSNVDWGQDLPALAAWEAAHPSEPVSLRYFGSVPPHLYGVKAKKMTDNEVISPIDGVYAISAHSLVYFRKAALQTGRQRVDWLSRYQPFERVGGSIYLYRFP